MSEEIWRPIPGFEGLYEASNTGRVRSLDRIRAYMQRGGVRYLPLKGKLLKPVAFSSTGPYLSVSLHSPTHVKKTPIHRAVLLAFVGQPPFEAADGCHRDGNPKNNHISNLYWGSRQQNCADTIRHGRNPQLSKTECPQGHEYTPENTAHVQRFIGGPTFRCCRICRRRNRAAYKRRQKAVAQ